MKNLKRQFLTQFLNKISTFPMWVKEIIYIKLSQEFAKNEDSAYIFATYKPVLTYKGRCEVDSKKSGFDTNIYNILESADRYYIKYVSFNGRNSRIFSILC